MAAAWLTISAMRKHPFETSVPQRLAYALGAGAFWARDTGNALKRKLDAMRADRARPDQSRPSGDDAE